MVSVCDRRSKSSRSKCVHAKVKNVTIWPTSRTVPQVEFITDRLTYNCQLSVYSTGHRACLRSQPHCSPAHSDNYVIHINSKWSGIQVICEHSNLNENMPIWMITFRDTKLTKSERSKRNCPKVIKAFLNSTWLKTKRRCQDQRRYTITWGRFSVRVLTGSSLKIAATWKLISWILN